MFKLRVGNKQNLTNSKIMFHVTGPTPTLSPSFLLAQAIFEPSLPPLYEYLYIS
jgi:hypothetical protein